jgi:hypothetical protein
MQRKDPLFGTKKSSDCLLHGGKYCTVYATCCSSDVTGYLLDILWKMGLNKGKILLLVG